MIVCVCKAVNDRTIRRVIAEGHDTFDELQFELGVGTQCGKCVASVCEVLFDALVDTRPTHAAPVPARTVFPLRHVEAPDARPLMPA